MARRKERYLGTTDAKARETRFTTPRQRYLYRDFRMAVGDVYRQSWTSVTLNLVWDVSRAPAASGRARQQYIMSMLAIGQIK